MSAKQQQLTAGASEMSALIKYLISKDNSHLKKGQVLLSAGTFRTPKSSKINVASFFNQQQTSSQTIHSVFCTQMQQSRRDEKKYKPSLCICNTALLPAAFPPGKQQQQVRNFFDRTRSGVSVAAKGHILTAFGDRNASARKHSVGERVMGNKKEKSFLLSSDCSLFL